MTEIFHEYVFLFYFAQGADKFLEYVFSCTLPSK